MQNIVQFKKELFSVTPETFADKALELFRYQAVENVVYKEFLQYLDISPISITRLEDIPFLPIELFKTKKIITGKGNTDFYFESSGTTSTINSRHYVSDKELYKESINRSFSLFFGDIKQYNILALLPSYLDRPNASLVYMCRELMNESGHPQNGFYLDDLESLQKIILSNEKQNIPTILIGVTFALLDLAEKFPMPLSKTIIMETGGMKGRREEITRAELHKILNAAFLTKNIYSEYGMTELLSQAYSKGDSVFYTPSWMKILIRDTEDPFTILPQEKTGCINIIDLANIHSCSFIATQDLGKTQANGSFEVLGRFDNSDVRGCNLMIE